MKIKKRIVPIVLFFAIIAASIALGQWAVTASADTTAPMFQSISVDNSSIEVGGTITVEVTGSDDSSGLNRAEISYISNIGTYIHVTLKPDTSGNLKGNIVTSSNSSAGFWMVDSIELYDNADNKTTVLNSETYYFGNHKDLSAGDFTITGSVPLDYLLPGFNGVSVDKISAGPGNDVNVSLYASDAQSGINYASVQYTSESGAGSKIVVIVPDSEGNLKEAIKIGQYDEAGLWTVDSITICDNAGNILTVLNTEEYNAIPIDDPSFVLSDLSAGDFTVAGTISDTTAPSFGSLKVEYNTMPIGADASITIKASDVQSGISAAVLMYMSPSQTTPAIVILYPDSNGDLRADFPTSELSELGQWKVDSLFISDNNGNFTEVYNTEFYNDPSMPLADLRSGNITLVDGSSAPSGLKGVTGDSQNSGKITGATPYMEYKLSTETSYSPVIGTEITGLAPGNYCVRYSACGGYGPGKDAVIEIKSLYEIKDGVLIRYNGSGGDVSIPDNLGITGIGVNAFGQCYGLTSVVIPNGVTSIGESAFNQCYWLTSITLPSGLTSIGQSAFGSCYRITNMTLPSGLTSIGPYAFWYCENLESIIIPDSVTNIGKGAFWACKHMSSVTLPKGITTIGDSVFVMCCELTSIDIPDTVTSIGPSAFSGCSLTNFDIPDTVTSIGSCAFSSCGMTSVTIPEGYTSLSDGMFSDCTKLSSITIPDSVTSIGSGTFASCTSLTSINLPEGITNIKDFAFSGSGLTSISLPKGLNTLSDAMFYGCYNLKDVTLPDGLTKIGSLAFIQCYSLTSISIPSGVMSIGSGAFKSCRSLVSIEVPDGVTSIESDTFSECSNLTHISLPDGITSIGRDAFSWCPKLAEITIPSGVKTIEESAFSGCENLKTINAFPATAPATYPNLFFSTPLETKIYKIPGSVGYNVEPWTNRTVYVMSPPAIEVTTLPIKTEYYTDQSLNLAGIVVSGVYGDTRVQVPVSEANVSGFDSSVPVSGQILTVNIGGKTATFSIDVIKSPVEVLAGPDRFSTAAEISKASCETADTVILATAWNFPDALAAGPLAFQENAPILLTNPKSIPQATLDEIARLKATKVIVMGSAGAVGDEVAATLMGKGITVERVSGNNRFGTAVEVAKNVRAKSGVTSKAILAYGWNFPDALAIGSYASKEGIPILLTDSKFLTPETKASLTEFGISEVQIIGSTNVISQTVEDELKSMGINVTRSFGSNRFGTAADITGKLFPDSKKAIVANGWNFPDALAAVPYAAKMNAPILLAEQGSLPAEISSYLSNSPVDGITVVGGESAVGKVTRNQLLDSILN